MATATDTKFCVKCNKDVTRGKRMKDAQGRYWCVTCGTEDSKKKHTSKIICADCRGKYSPTEIQTVGNEQLCANCLTARSKYASGVVPTAASETADAVRAQRIKLGLALASFAGGVVLLVLYSMEIIG